MGKTEKKYSYFITVGGEEKEVGRNRFNSKGGASYYANKYKDATVRMRDSEKNDYDIPLSEWDNATKSGLRPFLMERETKVHVPSPADYAKYRRGGVKENVKVGEPMTFAKDYFKTTGESDSVATEADLISNEERVKSNEAADTISNEERVKSSEAEAISKEESVKSNEAEALFRGEIQNPETREHADAYIQAEAQKATQKAISEDVKKAFAEEQAKANIKAGEAMTKPVNGGFVPAYSGIQQGIERSAAITKELDIESMIGNVVNRIFADEKAVANAVKPYLEAGYDETTSVNKASEDLANGVQSEILAEYKKQNAPQSTLDYVLGNAFRNSIVAQLAKGLAQVRSGASGINEQVKDEAYAEAGEKAGSAARVVSGVGSLLLDAPVFGGLGSLSSGAVKGVTGAVTGAVAKKAIGASGKAGVNAASRYIGGNVGMRMAQGSLGTGLTLGSYDALGETLRGMRTNTLDAKEVLKRAGHGLGTGIAIGWITPAGHYLSRNMSATGKAMTDVGAFVTEAEIFNLAGLAEQGKILDLDAHTEGFAESAATLALMKGSHALGDLVSGNVGNIKAQLVSRYKAPDYANKARFTREELADLKRMGYNLGDIFTSKKVKSDEAEKALVTKDAEKALKKSDGAEVIAEVEELNNGSGIKIDGEFFDNYAKMQADERVPMQIKAKMAYFVEGKAAVNMPLATRVDYKQSKEGYEVETYDVMGRLVSRKRFKPEDKKQAESLVKELELACEGNSVNVMEQLYDRYQGEKAVSQVVKDLWEAEQASGKSKWKTQAEFEQALRQSKAGKTAEERRIWDTVEDLAKRTATKASDLRESIELKNGVEIAEILKKPANKRTLEEVATLAEYERELDWWSNEPEAVSKEERVISNEERVKSSEPEAVSNEERVESNEERAISNEERVKSNETLEVSDRRGSEANIEDLLAVYPAENARKEAEIRKNAEDFIDEIAELEGDRLMAIAWSKGEPASEKPDHWDYWKEREGLEEPVTISNEERAKSNEERVKSNEAEAVSNEERVKSSEPEAISKEERVKSKEQLVKSNEERVKSDEPEAVSSEERVKSNEKAESVVEEPERVDVQGRVDEWNEKTGEKVRVANNVEEVTNTQARAAIENGVKVKGWYDTKTQETVIYAPNVKDAHDIDRTVIHEVVSHKGLRDTLGGEVYDRLCDKTWEMMDADAQAKYENYPGVDKIEDKTKRRRAAADEYIASIAEKEEANLTEAERSVWAEVVKVITDFIKKIFSDAKITEDDIRAIIRASYRRMRERAESISSEERVKSKEQLVKSNEERVKSDEPEAVSSEERVKSNEKAESVVEEPERVDVQGRVDEWNEKTGEKVRVANNVEEVTNTQARAAIENGVKVKGWYDTKTQETVIYAPNVKDAHDIDRTVIHEVVSHKGLRDTLGGEVYDRLCDKTWEMMDADAQAKYENYPGVDKIEDKTKRRRAAADEYIASIAEKEEANLTEAERSVWAEVVKVITDFIKKLFSDAKITEDDIRAIIRASYRRMRERAELISNEERVKSNEADLISKEQLVKSNEPEAVSNEERVKSNKRNKVTKGTAVEKEITKRLNGEWSDTPVEVREIMERLSDMETPLDVEDVVYSSLESLRSPKTRHKLILQGDGVVKGVADELGLPARELQKMLGANAFMTRANGGISLQRMAEDIAEAINTGVYGGNAEGERGISGGEVSDSEIRTMLIDAINGAGEPADISYHRARRRIEVAEKVYADWKRNETELEAEYEREADAERTAEEFWLTEQEKAYESMEINYLDNTFADELAERERIINEQNRISNERINERGLGSNRLLRSQQTDTSGRVEEGSGRQGIQEEVGDVVSRIQNAETQRGQANSVAEREIRAKEVDFGKERTRLNTRLEEIDSRLTDTRVVDQLQTDVDKAIAIYGGAENMPKELYNDLLSRSNAIREETQELYREKYEIEEQLRVLDENEKTAIKEAEREVKLAKIEKKYSGFLSGKSRVEQGRVDKVLSKPIRYNGVAMTKGQMIETLIDEGVRFEPSSINGKKIYIARIDDNSYYEITKTEYEYARHLGGKTLTQEEAAKAEQKLRYETLRKKYSGLISVKGDLDRRIAWLERALKGGNPNNTAGKKMQAELAELRELKDLSEGEARFSVEEERNLVGLHNLTEANLAHAKKMGGIANPSMAVVNRDIATLDNFGEITLVASKALVDKKSGKNAGTWGADAYSPRYPRVEYRLSEKASKELRERGESAGLDSYDISSLEQEIESNGKRYLVGDRKIQKLFDAEGKNGESISEYVDRFYDGLDITERLFKGYSWDGTRRYAKHTLENVSRMMKAEGRAGAEGNFGMGSVRATLTPIFKNIAQIKKSKDRIVSHEDFEKAKESLETRFYELSRLVSTGKYDFAAEERLGEAMLSRNPKEYLEQEYGIEISDEESQEIKTLAADLSVMPTEYFETKFERPVMLEEFAKAVIPNDATAKTRQILADAGLEVVEYDPNVKGDRLRAVREASERDGIRFSVDENGDKKTSLSERSDAVSDNSSSKGLLRGGKEHLSRVALTAPEDFAKLQQNSQNTINSARKYLNAGGFNNLDSVEKAVKALGEKLKLKKSRSSLSYYGDFYEGDFLVEGRNLKLRISTHPANGERMGNLDADDKVSIVIYKNGEHTSTGVHNGYIEYTYNPEEVALNDAANAVLKGVINLIENGEYIDETQKAILKDYPYVDDKGHLRFSVEDADYSGDEVRFAVVEDKDVLRRFEEEPLVKTYRAMVKIGDQLYPPMSSKEEGKLREGNKLGDVVQAVERPDLAFKKNGEWHFWLTKDNGDKVPARYNPYLHSSDWMMNDQFKQAQDRPNLVVVEMGLLPSDIERGYHAEKAKDSTGVIEGWKSGDVAAQLPQKRKVWLTQYGKILREVPTKEVAQHIYDKINGYVDVMPTNVVSPQVREELEKMGVKFIKTDNQGVILDGENAGNQWVNTYGKETIRRKAKAKAKKAAKAAKDSKKADEGEVRFRFMGEKGAKTLDKSEGVTTRLDNLAVAKDMENAGEDAKSVKMATGWERGKDKKWRYETTDFDDFDVNGNFLYKERHPDYARYQELRKKNNSALLLGRDPLTAEEQAELAELQKTWAGMYGKMDNNQTLPAYIKDDKLFAAYPELRDIKVKLTSELPEGTRGRFVREREYDGLVFTDEGDEVKGTIYLSSRMPIDQVKSTLAHELQHVIQAIEGFAKGGSTKQIDRTKESQKELTIGFIEDRISTNQEAIEVLMHKRDAVSDKMADWRDRHGDDAPYDAEWNEYNREWDALDKEIDKISELVRADEKWLDEFKEMDTRLGYEGYRRLAGEVEARNVQKRMDMSEAERRAQLASETEDVPRYEQKVLGSPKEENSVRFAVREEEVAKANENFHLTKDNADNFEWALMQSIAGDQYSARSEYKKLGDLVIRVKDHTPNWDNFENWETGEAVSNEILNVTVGDYNNTDASRNKTTYEDFVTAHPEVKAVDVEIEDGTYLGDAIAKIKSALKDKGIEIEFNPAYDWVEKYSEDNNTLEWNTRFSAEAEGGYKPVWNEGESWAEANDRIRRRKSVIDIKLRRLEQKKAMGKAYDEAELESLQIEKRQVDAEIRYLEVGAPKPELAEGEKETDASYVLKMQAWHNAMAEWNSKKWGEDAMLDNMLRNASGAGSQMSEEEFKKNLEADEEKANLSVKEMKSLIKNQIRERRRGLEVSNWQDEMTIYGIKKKTTEAQRKLIPHILEGTFERPEDRKDSRYRDYLSATNKKDVSDIDWEKREELLHSDPFTVDNVAITKNRHGLKQSDVVEYAVDNDADIFLAENMWNALIRFENGDLCTLDRYGVEYALYLKPEIAGNILSPEDVQLLAMFLRGEAVEYPPKGLREYVEMKEYNDGSNTLEVAQEVRDWYSEAWNMLEAEGMTYKKEAIEDYVTHIWDLKASSPTAVTTMQKFMAATAPKALKDVNNFIATNTPYIKEREIGSIKDGMAFGLVPKYEDITDIMRDYGHRMNEARENRRLVNFVKGLRVNGMDAIKEAGSRVDGLYVPITNNALRGYEVHRDVKPVLDIVFGNYHTTDNIPLQKLGHIYDAWGGLLKKINLSLSFFHHGALTETAVAMTNPFYAGKTIFKNILWDAAFKGDVIKWAKTVGENSESPAFNDVELTKDAVSHFVQLGATSDYATKEVQAITSKFAKWAEGKIAAEEVATILDFWNKGMDKMLWDYLHDGLKIYGYGKIAGEIRAKAKKEEWSEQDLNRALDEAGQLINDTYGGQYWDLLGVSPNALKWARRMFLSPDWTLSTIRQALAPFGVGQLYNDDNIWKKWFKNDPVASVRKRYGRAFWVTAGIFAGIVVNGLNAYYRIKDEDEEKEKADEIRKTNPEYKSPYELAYPDGMKWWEYTMLGNTLGHETHLFAGRYEDGEEQYVRWGKQFRELPELFYGRDGLSFPQPMIDKITGKLNPMINLMSNLASGYSLNGFQNSYMKNKRGWAREFARLQVLVAAHLPYSIPTDEEKEFKLIDLMMPSTKGFSNWKAIDRFKTGIASGDLNFIGSVYDACVMNGIDADKMLDIAIKQIEAEVKQAMVEGVKDLEDAANQYDSEPNPERKRQLAKYIRQQLSAQDYKQISEEELLENAQEAISGVSNKKQSMYEKLHTVEDLIEDFRITKGKAGLKKYVDRANELKEAKALTEYAEYVSNHTQELNKYKQLTYIQGEISELKRRLGEGDDAEVMAKIRELRKKAFEAQGESKPQTRRKTNKAPKPIGRYGDKAWW